MDTETSCYLHGLQPGTVDSVRRAHLRNPLSGIRTWRRSQSHNPQRANSLLILARASAMVLAYILLTGCSGGSDSPAAAPDTDTGNGAGSDNVAGNGGENDSGAQGPNTSAVTGIASLPNQSDQPNTVSQHIVVDSNGIYHATYADIDGRVFYASCSSSCAERASWSSVTLDQFDVDLSGDATPKIVVENSGVTHIAIVADNGSLFRQDVYYARCDTNCTASTGWSLSRVVELGSTRLRANLQAYNWFAVSPNGQPAFAFIDPFDTFELGDYLYYYTCQSSCSSQQNWVRHQVASIDFAFPKPAHLKFDRNGTPHLATVNTVTGADFGEVIYTSCVEPCDISAPRWNTLTELGTVADAVFNTHGLAFDLLDNVSPVIATFQPSGEGTLNLMTCTTGCTDRNAWSSRNVRAELPLPTDLTLPEEGLTLRTDAGEIELGLIGKDRNFAVPHRVVKLSCTGSCETGNWRYTSLADTASITYEDVGICVFFGTGAIGPVSLLPEAVGFGAYPHWGCRGGPVLITETDFGTYVDYNDDVRFFEIAVIGVI